MSGKDDSKIPPDSESTHILTVNESSHYPAIDSELFFFIRELINFMLKGSSERGSKLECELPNDISDSLLVLMISILALTQASITHTQLLVAVLVPDTRLSVDLTS